MRILHSAHRMVKTVVAREHHGAESLDLTIPADIVRRFDLSKGDVFAIEVDEDEGDDGIVIRYRRVFSQGEKAIASPSNPEDGSPG